MSTVLSECTKCHCTYPRRERADIADKLQEAMRLSLREADPERRYRSLTAHLLWLEAELRGYCTNCTLQEAAAGLAEASTPPAEPEPLPENVHPILRRRAERRASFYEDVFGPVRTSAQDHTQASATDPGADKPR